MPVSGEEVGEEDEAAGRSQIMSSLLSLEDEGGEGGRAGEDKKRLNDDKRTDLVKGRDTAKGMIPVSSK